MNFIIEENEHHSEEVWKPILGSDGRHEVSSLGRVRSAPRTAIQRRKDGLTIERPVGGRILCLTEDRRNYGRLMAKVWFNGSWRTMLVHRLVARAFIGEALNGMEVAHFDGNPKNNNISNLRYATPKDNTGDKKRHGTLLFGEDIASAKLKASDVQKIRKMRENGDTLKDIGDVFGVSIAQVSRIANGKQWRNV